MRRREFIAVLVGAAFAGSLPPRAQQPQRMWRIGVLAAQSPALSPPILALRDGLRELGYVDGQNISIEWRWAHGRAERFAELTDDLVRLPVDIIVASANPAMRAAKIAAGTTPIVMVFVSDPIASGFVASLARPGGNVTGMSLQLTDLVGKGLELLKEALPKVARVAILRDQSDPYRREERREIEDAARALGLQLQIMEVRNASEFGGAFETMTREQAEGVFIEASTLTFGNRPLIAQLAATHRLPTVSTAKEYVADACLMSYAPSFTDVARRAAYFVDKILKGAKPADLPVEQPTKFELVINLKTATALGLTIPPLLLARADEVME